MNAKTLSLLLLTVVTLGLAGFLWKTMDEAKQERQKLTEELLNRSNEVVRTEGKVNELKSVNTHLETTLARKSDELSSYSNKWSSTTQQLAKTEQLAKDAAAAAEAEIAKRNSRINELSGEKDELSKKMEGLNVEISGLNTQIKDTETKLAASEGDRALLEKELKRLLAEKAELERKFNDLAVLKKQVQKLKDELSISRRLEFIRKGLYGFDKKGAEVLNEGVRPKTVGSNAAPGLVLNATVGTDGSAKVEVTTNAPASAPASPVKTP